MAKTTSPKPSAPEAKRMSFFPFLPDLPRTDKFAAIYAELNGLPPNVHPKKRDVYRFILDKAELGLAASNGHSHPPPPDKRGKN